MAVIVDMLTLGVKNAALGVAVNLDALLANFTKSVGLVGVRVDVKDRVGGMDGVRAAGPGTSSSRVRTRVGTRERTAVDERTANGENDAHCHGCGKHGGHACDNGPDGIINASWGDNEPEQDVGHVDYPDGAVEVEAIAEHQLPETHWLVFEGLDRVKEGETKRNGVEQGGGDPIDSYPGMLRPSNASLARFQRDREIEGTADGGDDELNCPKSTHPGENGAALIENGMDSDNMSSRATGKENGGCNWFE